MPKNAPSFSSISASPIEMKQLTLPEVLHEISTVMVSALFDDVLHAESDKGFCTKSSETNCIMFQSTSMHWLRLRCCILAHKSFNESNEESEKCPVTPPTLTILK